MVVAPLEVDTDMRTDVAGLVEEDHDLDAVQLGCRPILLYSLTDGGEEKAEQGRELAEVSGLTDLSSLCC